MGPYLDVYGFFLTKSVEKDMNEEGRLNTTADTIQSNGLKRFLYLSSIALITHLLLKWIY